MAIAQSRTSRVRPDIRRISEKYLTCNKRKTSGHLPKLGARCPIMQSVASLARSWTSGVQLDVRGMSEKYLSCNTEVKVAAVVDQEASPTPTTARQCSDNNDAWGRDNDDDSRRQHQRTARGHTTATEQWDDGDVQWRRGTAKWHNDNDDKPWGRDNDDGATTMTACDNISKTSYCSGGKLYSGASRGSGAAGSAPEALEQLTFLRSPLEG